MNARDLARAGLSGWVGQLGEPAAEPVWSRRMARIGGIAAAAALFLYIIWRVAFTMPSGDGDHTGAWMLVVFEAVPIVGVILNVIRLWNIDSPAPAPVLAAPDGMRVAVLIPTYNEPVEVLTPTVAAACALEPFHETWVLDDGGREWVKEMCAAYGARYVDREHHHHAKAGNMNHALALMAEEEAAGAPAIGIIAVLDCDHVPLPTFLTATLGWFADPDLALVQGPQAFYNTGAFDDDGITGEQGLFFNVQMPARNAAGAGPFWCGSTSLLRVSALKEVGGVATETITEDMHTTLKLIRLGWKTAYHHQTLAVGLGPATPEQYLLQRRRWGMGAMQILTHERLWAAKKWMSWRNFDEYLNGTLWWLEGIATILAFCVPVLLLLSGVETTTADPGTFAAVFLVTFSIRLWGAKQLMRRQIHWPTAFALRIFRIPVGIACLWWLVTRNSLEFEVTPKGAADQRTRGASPRILGWLAAMVLAAVVYIAGGIVGLVPSHADSPSTVAGGMWLLVSAAVMLLGLQRIRSEKYATSRRNAHRVELPATGIRVNGIAAELLDVSVGGVSVSAPYGAISEAGTVILSLPGSEAVRLERVRLGAPEGPGAEVANFSLRVVPGDWAAYRTISLWMFHTPPGALPGFPPGVPAVASTKRPTTRTDPSKDTSRKQRGRRKAEAPEQARARSHRARTGKVPDRSRRDAPARLPQPSHGPSGRRRADSIGRRPSGSRSARPRT